MSGRDYQGLAYPGLKGQRLTCSGFRKWYPGVNDVWRPDSLSGCTSELSQLPTNTHNSPEIASGLHFPGIHCDPSHGKIVLPFLS
jgi:hypothetical protein